MPLLIKEFDQYEPESADREHYDLNPEARRQAEKELNKRDQQKEVEEDLD